MSYNAWGSGKTRTLCVAATLLAWSCFPSVDSFAIAQAFGQESIDFGINLLWSQNIFSQACKRWFRAVLSDFRLFANHARSSLIAGHVATHNPWPNLTLGGRVGTLPATEQGPRAPWARTQAFCQSAVQRLSSGFICSPGVVRHIPKIFVCFVVMCAEACIAPVYLQPIVLLIVLLCFQVDPDWFTEPGACCPTLPLKMAMYQGRSGNLYPQKRHVHFPNRGAIRMAC